MAEQILSAVASLTMTCLNERPWGFVDKISNRYWSLAENGKNQTKLPALVELTSSGETGNKEKAEGVRW